MAQILDLMPTEKRRRGRPTLLESERETARVLACARYQEKCGASVTDAAEKFGVTRRTIFRWRKAMRGQDSGGDQGSPEMRETS